MCAHTYTHCAGNYCQPRCDEPWTEVLFESGAEGKVRVAGNCAVCSLVGACRLLLHAQLKASVCKPSCGRCQPTARALLLGMCQSHCHSAMPVLVCWRLV
jgi:hypothetical protein